MNVALYARVSTAKQAERDLSIPDQIGAMKKWCKGHNYTVAVEYIEPGASGTSDRRRPVFQQMMADACVSPPPFNAIIVHSLSRFFRDSLEFCLCERRLRKHGVVIISISQQTSADPAGEMARRIFSLFDEYSSKENGKHTLRALEENARQGNFNGSSPPYSFRTEEVAAPGNKGKKKRLVIDTVEAENIRTIYDLYINGYKGEHLGVKGIARHLSAQGLLMRGKPWKKTLLDKILSNPLYPTGEYYFNKKEAKSGTTKPESEWVKITFEPIIDAGIFYQAQKKRTENSLRSTLASSLRSPSLLTGFLRCGSCGSPMTLASGKGGRYRYYKCTTKINGGSTSCNAGNIRAELLDSLVMKSLSERVLTPERLSAIIHTIKNSLVKSNAGSKGQMTKLSKDLEGIQQKIGKLYEAVEQGFLPMDNSLRERIDGHHRRKQMILSEMANLRQQQELPLSKITPQHIKAFCDALREKLMDGESKFGKEYLKLLLKEVRVTGNEVRLKGKYDGVVQSLQSKKSGHPILSAQTRPLWLPSALPH